MQKLYDHSRKKAAIGINIRLVIKRVKAEDGEKINCKRNEEVELLRRQNTYSLDFMMPHMPLCIINFSKT